MFIIVIIIKRVDLNLEEGFYWLDKQIIKAYDKQGKLHKIHRLKIDDDLNITYTSYKLKKFEVEPWQDTIKRNQSKLKDLEWNSLKTVKEKIEKYQGYTPIVLNSTGKDSIVTDYLVNKIIDTQRIFNNTTLGCYDEYQYINKLDKVTKVKYKEGFYKWRKRNSFVPTRFNRACCYYFKEYATTLHLDKSQKYMLFMGMRSQESAHRSSYGDEWKNDKWGNCDWIGILPIVELSEEDIWLYILWKGLDFNTKYRKGYSRVGCAIACPFYTKSTWVLDKYWYPKMYKRWHDILEKDFIENFKWTRLNCTLKEYHSCWNGGLKRTEPTQEVINEFAQYKNITPDVAEKYFNHECKECTKIIDKKTGNPKIKKVNKKDEVAMNLKLLGRNIENYYCKKHLMDYLEISKEQWNQYIDDFKKQGCDLF